MHQQAGAREQPLPGRTRNVEHFRVGTLTSKSPWMLADTPGYGFAKASKTERAVEDDPDLPERTRRILQNVFLLIDSRLEPQQNDLDMVQWLGENGIPFCIIFTKTDKLKAPKVDSNVAQFSASCRSRGTNYPRCSSPARRPPRRDELLAFIER